MVETKRNAGRPPVFISSPLSALVEGVYRADTTIGLLRQKGNLGIGTFNDLDGELVLLDDAVYCLRPQGDAERMADTVRTPSHCAPTSRAIPRKGLPRPSLPTPSNVRSLISFHLRT